MNFDVLALGFAPEFANQWERLTADGEMPAIVLDAPHLVERLFIERWLTLLFDPIRAQQPKSAIVAKHFWMHPGKVGGDHEWKERGLIRRKANEGHRPIHVERKVCHVSWRLDVRL